MLRSGYIFTVFLLFFVSLLDLGIVGGTTLPYEVQALEDFYNSLNGEGWRWRIPLNISEIIAVDDDYLLETPFNEGYRPIWNFTGYHDPCDERWQGINCTCSNTTLVFQPSNFSLGFNTTHFFPELAANCTITSLELADYNLTGQIPSSIANLTYLRILYLNTNNITGTIPPAIGNMSNLHFISFAHNNLISTIPPEIGNCTFLQHLHLENNHLSGEIPNSTYSLSSLMYFNVGSNNLHGRFSPLFGNLSRLHYLEIYENQFTGTIPEEISKCTLLFELLIYSNYLSGSIIDGLQDLVNLNYFYIADNKFTGPIPAWIGASAQLYAFDGGQNELTGTIPHTLCDQSYSLGGLFLYGNQLHGSIPNCFTGERSPIIEFVLYHNFITGTIPSNFTANILLEALVVGDNLLTGTVPHINNAPLLEFLYVQNNMLTGNLHEIFDPPNQKLIEFLDFSDNEFTGTIPKCFYGLKGLNSLAMVSNCFSGSISEQICNMTTLEYLELDGIHTADNCQHSIFPFFTSYIMKNHMTGSIPSCLFNLKKIQSIHLSGNALKSTFPKDLEISPTVTDITLSHNLLRGDIPVSMQSRRFSTLDLSYNCFSGEIYNNFTLSDYVNLEVNRLSGGVPAIFRHATNIKILNSNLFACDYKRSTLPLNDPNYDTFQCGSNSFDVSYIVWAILFGGILALYCGAKLSFYYKENESFKKTKEYFLKYTQLFHEYMSIFAPIEGKINNSITEFAEYLTKLRLTFVRLTVVICVGLCPLYFLLSAFYKTHTHEYAWNASALYLSGEPPAIILLFVFLGFLTFIFVSLRKFLLQWLHEEAFIGDATSNEKETVESKFNRRRALVLSFVAIVNCTFMLVLNSLYIFFVFKFDAFIVFACQLMIAIIKIFWNEYVLSWMVRTGKEKTKLSVARVLSVSKNPEEGQGALFHCEIDRQRDLHEAKLLQDRQRLEDANDMPILTFIVIFNTIIAPVIANAVLSDSCYENVFLPPPRVESNSAYSVCKQEYTLLFTNLYCNNEITANLSTAYDPPFIYRYECSSAFIRHYASVYVYMFLLTGFGKPLGFLIWKHLYNTTVHPLVKRLMSLFLNKMLKEELIDATRLQSEEILFRKERFVLNNVSATCVLLTIGVVFPPIAVVVLFAIFSHTYMNQLIIGRFVHCFEGEKRDKVVSNLCRDCEGVPILFKHSLLFMIPFTSIFYAFYLLDIYGDAVGWRRAIWASVIVFIMPILVYSVYQVYRIFLAVRHQNKEKVEVQSKITRARAETIAAMNRSSYYNRTSGSIELDSRKSKGVREQANSSVMNPMNPSE